jgi:hypothetical protein
MIILENQLSGLVRPGTNSQFDKDNQQERSYSEGSPILTNIRGDICVSLIVSSEPHAGVVTASAKSLSIWRAKG